LNAVHWLVVMQVVVVVVVGIGALDELCRQVVDGK
jgi:Sec-independent protein translocase protein TatA